MQITFIKIVYAQISFRKTDSQMCDHSKIRFIPFMHMMAFKEKEKHYFKNLSVTVSLYMHVHTDIPPHQGSSSSIN